jgi:hypothetical protein
MEANYGNLFAKYSILSIITLRRESSYSSHRSSDKEIRQGINTIS